jgi:glutathione synthase/RimK-type ligase-like ATP-grasp enzyme
VTDVLLATCASWPDGEPGGHLLLESLEALGFTGAWAVWDDPSVRWESAALVAVRSTWDYQVRREEFLAWTEGVGPRLMNGARTMAWNTDKSYLTSLADAGLPVVPTRLALTRDDVARSVEGLEEAVVKPTVGASGRGVVVLDDPTQAAEGAGPWVVQPVVASVRTEGEVSVYVFGGQVASMVRKTPAPGGSILVHETYGGRSAAVPVTAEHAELAGVAVRVTERLLDVRLDYARVDLMRLADGQLVVGELEATEPGLYLDVVPENARAFAAMVAARLSG